MRLWIGLHLPRLPLEVFTPSWSTDTGSAVLEHERVLVASQSALDAGVRAGMRRGGVVMLLPDARIHVRGENLRRLHLAAQAGETLFFMMRPLTAGQDASPAPLRLALRPQAGGIEIGFVKRRGPQRDATLFLPLTSYLPDHHAPVDRPAPAPVAARSVHTELVH